MTEYFRMKKNGPKSTSLDTRLPKCPTGIQGLDEITDGGVADALMQNAPEREDTFFVVPKVVE